jgi:hypothetical protein
MRTIVISVAATAVMALPLLAGVLMVEIGNPSANAEALSKHAVLVVRTTACHSPEKTTLTATAEGAIDGRRRTFPLTLIPLSTPGTYGIARESPFTGTWAIKIVATNPEYQHYATGALIRFDGNSAEWTSVKHFYHKPTSDEVNAMLEMRHATTSASLADATFH